MIGPWISQRHRSVVQLVYNPEYDVPTSLGSEIITNGDFSGGTTGWTFGTGWSVSGGKATATVSLANAQLSQSLTLDNSKVHRLQFTFSISAGTDYDLKVEIGGQEMNLFYVPGRTGQTYTIDFTPNAASTSLVFSAWTSAGTTIQIDNVTLKEATATKTISVPQWYAGGLLPHRGNYNAPENTVEGGEFSSLSL